MGAVLDFGVPDATTEQDSRPASPASLAARALLAAIAALVLGGLTSPAQGLLPDALSSFANSAGGWTLLTFAIIWAVRTPVWLSTVLGAVCFVLLVEGYRLVSGWRGFDYGEPFTGMFTIIGVLAGPIVGAAAAVVRHRSPLWRGIAIAPVAAVLIGEGVYGLTVVADTTSPIYWVVQLVIGIALTLAVIIRGRMPVPVVALTLGLVAAGSAAFVAFYSALGGA